jgi:hypothetical protein
VDRLTAQAALRRVASLGLPDADETPFEVDSPDQLLLLADIQRMTVPLDRAISDGTILHDETGWSERCRERAIAAAETTLAAHAAAMTIGRLLEDGGVRAVVLKGCATGHLDYARPVDRFSSDVDILVPAADRDRIVKILGGEVLDSIRSPRWNDRFGHAVTVGGPTGVEIDVHTRLQHGYIGFAVPMEEALASTVDFSIGGVGLSALDPPSRLLLAALSASGVHRSRHATRDVPQLVLVTGVDWGETVERAIRWRVDGFFARGVLDAWSMFDLSPHPLTEWASTHRPRGRQRLVTRWTGPRSHVLAAPLALPPSDWLAYTWPLLRPSSSYVERTGKGGRERWRILSDELRRRQPEPRRED